jgi:large subunit ribosomal protein L25
MAELKLLAEPGRTTGTRPSRRLRATGRIPAVVYGEGVQATPVSVAARDLRAVLTTEAGLNAVLALEVDGETYTTMARELQRHPVRGTVVHVDFQVVDPNREVSADVPIQLVGEPVELNHADGVIDQQMFAVNVLARPSDIPPNFEVDISGLSVGAAIRLSEIELPAGVRTDLDPESVIVAGQPPRVQVEEAEAAPEEEGAAAEAEGAEQGGRPPEAAGAEGGSSGSEES